jgi:hypothetical protein
MGRLTHVTASLFGLVSLFGGGGASHHESLPPQQRTLPLPRGVDLAVRVRRGRSVLVRSGPEGPSVGTVGWRTEFGSPRLLPVLARRGAWLKVVADVPGRTSGWVRGSRRTLELTARRWQIVIDRSRGLLTATAGGRVVKRHAVGVGRAGSRTPLGRFAVTDKLSGRPYGGAYGCCVLALSGHQRHLPGGWTGGDRLAIHATAPGRDPRSGSAGCVVGTDSEIAWLTRRVPLGTLVTVRR